MFHIYDAPSNETSIRVTEDRHQIKLETYFLIGGARLEKSFEFGILIDWAHGFYEARPIGSVQKFSLTMLFQYLRYDDELIVDAFSLLPLLLAIGGEVEKILAFDRINVGLGAKFLEGLEDRPVGAVGPQRAVISDVFQIVVDNGRQGSAL